MNRPPEKKDAKAIFSAAIEYYAPDQWEAYIVNACGEDESLRQRVRELLDAHRQSDSLFDRQAERTDGLAITERPGSQIGPYKLLQEIGEGGFGVVYMAEQVEPVRRKVALKIIKPGMDTKQVIARFEAERQALAMMDHPNIAKVLDAGATESGRPYFVMELVRGVPVTEFCDSNKLPSRARLELFVTVCRAIQHAHHKGVIHRDLKPTNVMVTINDNRPMPIIIDFGVSKALSHQLTEKTLFTAYGQMIGTPAYMSPEQAQMTQLDIDTRSDIYSLGVLLYELLTGGPPLDEERLRGTAYAELQRLIREEEAPKPSTQLSTLGDAVAKIAQQRGTDPRRLRQFLHGDLDWIVMKALDKERNRRYDTANGLANDIERFLSDEAVEACPPSFAYQMRKLVGRHRGLATTAIAVAAAVLLGIIGTTIGMIRAKQSEANARVAQQQAETLAGEKQQEAERAPAAEQRVERQVYASDMNFASYLLQDGQTRQVSPLLDRHLPSSDADQRGFEWYRYWRRCHSDFLRLTHWGPVRCLAFSPDGRRLAVYYRADSRSSRQFRIRLVDLATGIQKASAAFHSHVRSTKQLVFSPDGSRLAGIPGNGKLFLWDVDDLQNPDDVMHEFDEGAYRCAFSPDGSLLAVGGTKGGVYILDAQSYEVTHQMAPHDDRVWHVKFIADGQQILSCDREGDANISDVATGKSLDDFSMADQMGGRAIISPDGTTVAWATVDNEVAVGRLNVDQQSDTIKVLNESEMGLTQDWFIALSPNGETLLSAKTGEVSLSDVMSRSRTVSRPVSGSRGAVGCTFIQEGPQKGRAIAASLREEDDKLRVWDVATDETLTTFDEEVPTPSCIAISPDGRTVCVGGFDGVLWVGDVESGRKLGAAKEHASTIFCAQFSPDSRTLATGGLDRIVRVWDRDTCALRATCKGHSEEITALAFSPKDKNRLVSTSFDLTVRLWDAETGEPHATAHGYGWSLAFTPDGRRVAASANESTILIDADTGDEVGSLDAYGAALAFSPKGDMIAIVDRGWRVQFVRWATADEVEKDRAERRIRRERQQHDMAAINTFRNTVLITSKGQLSADDRREAESTLIALRQTPEYYRAFAPMILLSLVRSYASATSATDRDTDRVVELLEEIERLAVNDQGGLRWVAKMYGDLGNWSASREALEKALDAEVWPSSRTLYSLARLLATCPEEELRDPGRVADLARKVVQLYPESRRSHYLESAFNKYDTNSDKVLDAQERYTASRGDISPEADFNGNGAIDLNEFKSYDNQRRFNLIDADDDGKIQRDEVVTGDFFPSLFEEMDVNRDDTIALDEFERAGELYPMSWLSIARRSRPTFGGVGGPGSVTLIERFAEHDENQDGMVTKDEAGEDYWETIAACDADGSGAVDDKEHQAGLREQTLAKNRRFFSQMDRNADGQASEDEVPSGLWERWKSFDADGDNLLNEDEFMQANEPTAIESPDGP